MKTLMAVTPSIRRLFTVERLVHSIMTVFALASVGNVSSYLQDHGHHPLTSYALGIALGGVLVVTAMALADVDYEHDRERFWFMVIVVVVIGLLSGTVQTWAYGSHEGMDIASARLMGYGFPIACEGLLAVYIATYGTTRRRKNIRMATEGTAEQVAGAVAEALADVDVTKVRRYVERRVDGLTRAIVDGVIDELMPATPSVEASDIETIPSNVEPTAPSHPDKNTVFETNIDKANQDRSARAYQRRLKFLAVLDSSMSKEDVNFAQVGRALDNVSGQTIANDLKWLESEGYWKNGSDWRMTERGRAWMEGT